MIGITHRLTRPALIGFALMLSGCAPTERTAPCDPLAVTASLAGCGPERPVNVGLESDAAPRWHA